MPTNTGLPTSWRAIDAADDLETVQAVIFGVDQHEADFIHVGGDHDFSAPSAWARARDQHVTQGIHMNFIRVGV